jgi:hypothetical protein
MSARWRFFLSSILAWGWLASPGSANAQSLDSTESEVRIEIQLVQVSPRTARQIAKQTSEHGQLVRGSDGSDISIDPVQQAALLKIAQRDPTVRIHALPRITLFNGQKASLDCSELHCRVRPVLQADSKQIRVSLLLQGAERPDAKNAFPCVTKTSGTFSITPGHTLVWDLGERVTRMPRADQFFPGPRLWNMAAMILAMGSTESGHLYALVTPHLVANPSEQGQGEAEEQSMAARPRTQRLMRKSYSIADLIETSTSATEIMDLIQQYVASDSWDVTGGQGTMQHFAKESEIVVNQFASVHEQVERFFTSMREIRDRAVNVEAQFVHLSEPAAAQWLKKFESPADVRKECGSHGVWSTLADDEQIQRLLQIADKDCATLVQDVPSFRLANGQKVRFEASQRVTSTSQVRLTQGSEFSERSPLTSSSSLTSQVMDKEHIWHFELQRAFGLSSVGDVSEPDGGVHLSLKLIRGSRDAAGGRDEVSHMLLGAELTREQTMVWYLGAQPGTGRHLFVLLTPHTPHYLQRPSRYYPPSASFPLQKELKSLEEASKQQEETPQPPKP